MLLFERRAAVALCSFELSALVLLLLRRLFMSRLKIAIYDVGVAGTWKLRRHFLNFVVPRADALLPFSSNQAAEISRRWKPGGFVQAAPMCIDCDFYREAPDRPDGPVLAIGDDISRDYATFLQAIETVSRDVVIRTRKLRQDQIKRPNLVVLRQFLAPLEYRELIASAVIVVLPLHPSSHPGGITALVQAMASGKAVVVSASEGIAEYLHHEQTCLVVPCHDPSALRAAVERLLRDDALRISLGRAARAYMLVHGSLSVEADFLQGVITRLTQPPDNRSIADR